MFGINGQSIGLFPNRLFHSTKTVTTGENVKEGQLLASPSNLYLFHWKCQLWMSRHHSKHCGWDGSVVLGVHRVGIPLSAPPACSGVPHSSQTPGASEEGDCREWASTVGREGCNHLVHQQSVTLSHCSSPLHSSLLLWETRVQPLQESVSQVRAGVKRGFPLTACLLQKEMTQLLPSPFRTVLHTACHWPACYRWLSAQHPGDRAVKCHQIQTPEILNSLHQTWIMAPRLFLLERMKVIGFSFYFHTPAALGVYFCFSQCLCCL